ncbi:MAG: UDP-2,3-diacylglucosamine diphosphatase [Hyphomicrobiales bacterium]|nr:MAG: UDP-2,3-diacylglucosamine diphosphatase [Hyphomicrobiales bacterium]
MVENASMTGTSSRFSHRSLFISDVHLGSRFSDVRSFADFLDRNDAETIYLVGDIFDLWSLGKRVRWTEGHGYILSLLCQKMQGGARIVLLPGNHDDNLRPYLGLTLGRFEIMHDTVHETLTGARYLVVHGDEHDEVVMRLAKLSRVACRWKERLMPKARFSRLPKAVVPPGEGLWETLKRRAGNTNDIEAGLANEAARRGLDGVISGHTHTPADRRIASVHYLNCGDWMGSSTAVSENWSGELSLLHWHVLAHNPAAARLPAKEFSLPPQLAGAVS